MAFSTNTTPHYCWSILLYTIDAPEFCWLLSVLGTIPAYLESARLMA